MKDKTLILFSGFSCNNNCLICSVDSLRKRFINLDTPKLYRQMSNGRKEGYLRVEFTGGEPSIRKDIFKLMDFAGRSGYKEIALSSNGRLFFYKQNAEEFAAHGLNRINISLYGHNAKVHDAITRTPGSFEQTVSGIKSLKEGGRVNVGVNTVVTRYNYKFLSEIGTFIVSELGIDRWVMMDLIPAERIKPFYKSVSVRFKDLSREFGRLKSLIDKGLNISFFDFSLCIFPPVFRSCGTVSLFAAGERKDFFVQRGIGATRIKEKRGIYNDKYKIRAQVCQGCIYSGRCGGVWKMYLDLYKEDEIALLAAKHKCLMSKT